MSARNANLAWHYEGLAPSEFQSNGGFYNPAHWRAFAFRRSLALFLLFGWAPLAATLFFLSRMFLHQPIVCLATMFAWLSAAIAAVWWAGEFRCPRCRRRYGAVGHRRGGANLTRGIFDTICSNCKLRKFEGST